MIKKLIVILFFLTVFSIYLHNLTRDIYSGDVGDLVTAAVTGGVAHPPGYPLFTFLGNILSRLPIPLPPVSKVGLISVFASLFGLILIYKFSLKVTKSIFLALLTTSILAFSYLYWLHAEIPEVFALNNFFIIAILYFAIRYYESKKLKDLHIVSFLSGLSLAHHQTILLLLPAIGLLIIGNRKQWGNIFKPILFFLIGLLPYLYVPVAASRNPNINWDNAINLNNFIRLILRLDYGGFAPSVVNGVPFIVKTIVAKNFLKNIVVLYSYQILLVAFFGAFSLLKKDKWLLLSLLTAFIIPGPLFIFYSASVITTTTAWGVNERFYLMASVIFIFFLPYGFCRVKDFIDKRVASKKLTYVLLAYFLIVPYFLIKYNFPKTSLDRTQIGNNLAKDFISYLPQNSLLFVSGDTTAFNLWYAKYGLNLRPDVEIINPGGVGGNIFLDNAVNAYFEKYPKTKLSEVVHKTIEELRKKRTLYSTYEMNIRLPSTKFVPRGLVYELVWEENIPGKEKYLSEVESQWKKLRPARRETLAPWEQNLVTPEIPLIYSNGLIRVADYLISQYNDPAKAEHYYRRALWIDNENPGGHAGLGLSLYKAYGDCRESVNQLKEAIDLYQIWKRYYLQLYILYDECGLPDKEKNELIKLYDDRFNEDLVEKVKKQIK
ncbi:hypothetical protein A2774_02060 [Candidatus Roizmanbacteria bacterium RIFCSPHIGHO2_01_FULL_39_12c]|uniref:Glycosyltransferase RgtA/B/C/D-like domain-containing protein n=1 Tax=Candidatus Roizmanbacteria bacterium RIFCSPHIGHO2_01_FULL_39_12c TaxID=1802031 RepID=A0A1F7GF95_9BACT|nr:MAG: hypothetical protein A2774_02060 [Candidatus Roizmanbacteria bacterium RIFCSPHIGHO2_01_FULL_39_12c]OGK47554.1 MAG: hypothetical protein A2963_00785 [Candidatus Roizmanbacteria bacterium RIFCSPLOWO2_01_FULL_40_13]